MARQGQFAEIVVATNVDDNFLPLIWPLARSIAWRLGWRRRVHLHVFHHGADQALADRLRRLRLPRLAVTVHGFDDRLDHLRRPGQLPPASYIRLLLPDLLPQCDRLIYLDADMLVRANLGELFDADLGDNPVGGVPDVPMGLLPPIILRPEFTGSWEQYCDQVLGVRYAPDRLTYINAGVMLMNLALLRAEQFSARAIDLATAFRGRSIWQDQDVVNSICAGRIALFDAKWDVMPEVLRGEVAGPDHIRRLIERQRQQQAIVHFAGADKPWRRWGPRVAEWLVLASFSPAARLGYPPLPSKFSKLNLKLPSKSRLLEAFRDRSPRAFERLRRIWRKLRGRPSTY